MAHIWIGSITMKECPRCRWWTEDLDTWCCGRCAHSPLEQHTIPTIMERDGETFDFSNFNRRWWDSIAEKHNPF